MLKRQGRHAIPHLIYAKEESHVEENGPAETPSTPSKVSRLMQLLKGAEVASTILAALVTTAVGIVANVASDQLLSRGLPAISSSPLVILGTVISIIATLLVSVALYSQVFREWTRRRELAFKRLVNRDREFFDMISQDVSFLLKSEGERNA